MQADLSITGHAIEARIYAENPNNNFSPETGKLSKFALPSDPNIRIDTGLDEGMGLIYDCR